MCIRDRANALLPFFAARAQRRLAEGFERAQGLVNDSRMQPREAWYEARNLMTQMLWREQAELRSFSTYVQSDPEKGVAFSKDLDAQVAMLNGWINSRAAMRGAHDFQPLAPWHGEPDASRIPVRTAEFGPLIFQNDDVLLDRLGSGRVAKIRCV